MLARVRTASLWGLEAFPVDCEVDVGPGLPGFALVGLPDAAGREVRDRVWPALRNVGLSPPDRKVTVNLAPADRRKEGSSADLAVALGVLAATEQVPLARLAQAAAIGEVALDGALRPVRGTLSLAEAAWRAGATELLCPAAAAPEAALVADLVVRPVATLEQVVAWARGLAEPPRQSPAPPDRTDTDDADLAEVRGLAVARRALEIAAAGGHHLLLVGTPGCGKTMLAQRLPGLLPPLAEEDALVVTRLHSAAGVRPPGRGLVRRPPFRAPHHSISRAGLLGGGAPPRPGEISLAHHGVLFLDELSQMPRHLLDGLREPLESGEAWIARAGATMRWPARVLLVAAMNPCPCGWLGHPRRACRCTPTQLAQHAARVSGPVLDRLDLQIEVRPLSGDELDDALPAESSAAVRTRVLAARERQRRRGRLNVRLAPRALREACALDDATRRLAREAMERGGFSMRAITRSLRVARTIADLAEAERVGAPHLAEALQYRAYEARRFAAPC